MIDSKQFKDIADNINSEKDRRESLAAACVNAFNVLERFVNGTTLKINDLAGEPLEHETFINVEDIKWYVKDWLWDEFNESLAEHPGPIEDHYTDRNMYDFFVEYIDGLD